MGSTKRKQDRNKNKINYTLINLYTENAIFTIKLKKQSIKKDK